MTTPQILPCVRLRLDVVEAYLKGERRDWVGSSKQVERVDLSQTVAF